jgi:hypothetical protein
MISLSLTTMKYTSIFLLAILVAVCSALPLQLRGYITSPSDANSYSFDVLPMGLACQLADANSQWGNLYLPVSECTETNMTLVFGPACSGAITQPVYFNETQVNFQYEASFFIQWGGLTYTKGYFTCYEPQSPDQIISAPASTPIGSVGAGDGASPPGGNASTLTLSIAALMLSMLALFL